MSVKRQFQFGPNVLLVDEQGCPGSFIASLEAIRQVYSTETGHVIETARTQNKSADLWKIEVRNGWFRGIQVEFTQPVATTGSLSLQMKRTSGFCTTVIIVFGLVPAILVFALLLLGKFFLDAGGGPPIVFLMAVAVAVGLLGSGLGTLLARFVDCLWGKALSHDELRKLADAFAKGIGALGSED